MLALTRRSQAVRRKDVVGRIGEDHLGPLAAHEGLDPRRIEGVAAHQAMGSELPQVPRLAPGRRRGRDHVVLRIAGLLR